MKDHPDDPGFINGINTSNQVYPVILAQPKSSLNDAREALKRTKYYDLKKIEAVDVMNDVFNMAHSILLVSQLKCWINHSDFEPKFCFIAR